MTAIHLYKAAPRSVRSSSAPPKIFLGVEITRRRWHIILLWHVRIFLVKGVKDLLHAVFVLKRIPNVCPPSSAASISEVIVVVIGAEQERIGRIPLSTPRSAELLATPEAGLDANELVDVQLTSRLGVVGTIALASDLLAKATWKLLVALLSCLVEIHRRTRPCETIPDGVRVSFARGPLLVRILAKLTATYKEAIIVPFWLRIPTRVYACPSMPVRARALARVEGTELAKGQSFIVERLGCLHGDLESPDSCRTKPSRTESTTIRAIFDHFILQIPQDATDGRSIHVGQWIIAPR